MINTDGLVLFGPGSEWLWSFLSDVALVVTLAGVYFQLRSDRATRAFDQTMSIRADWLSRPERHRRLVTLIALEGRDVADGMPVAAYATANWFNRLGELVHAGHLSLEQVGTVCGGDVIFWWMTIEPYLQVDRQRLGLDWMLRDFEYIATRMAEDYMREFGVPYALQETVTEAIDGYSALLQQDLDIERGVIPVRSQANASSAAAGS